MADAKKPNEFAPQDLIEAKSTFDPQAFAPESPDIGAPAGGPPSAGGTTAEQTRREQDATVFNNNPERDRDDHLVNIGRGHQTTGRM